MVQVPTATIVTVEPVAPDTVQTAVVCELKLTVRPELAVALTVNGGVPSSWLESAANVMVWGVCTWKTMVRSEDRSLAVLISPPPDTRSEERRVGKECR